MLDNLLFFSKEVSRVTLGTGIEGKLGVQAHTDKCQGIWRDLTDNVNTMSNALTEQVRAIAEVTKAVRQSHFLPYLTFLGRKRRPFEKNRSRCER